jgi:hypothetical protein
MGNGDKPESGWTLYWPELHAAEYGSDADVLSPAIRRKHTDEVLTLHGSFESGSVAMTNFEERVLRDLGELKAHMRWIVGNGNEGKIQELESRIQKHEAALQRTAGLGVAAGILLTIMHLALDSLRTIHH